MHKLELYDGTKTYQTPAMTVMTPERMREKYPATKDFRHVIETDASGEVMMGLYNFAMLRGTYDIDPALDDDAAIAAIEEKMNHPAEEPLPSEYTEFLDGLIGGYVNG